MRSGETAAWRRIEARQALLNASNDPAATYRFLEEELGLEFDHRRRVQGEVPDRPTRLDQEVIDTDRLLGEVLQDRTGKRLRRVSDAMLEQLVSRRSPTGSGSSSSACRAPTSPGWCRPSSRTSRLPEAQLRRSQDPRPAHPRPARDAARRARPQVLSNAAYVDAVMRRLAPGADASIDDPAEEQRYLGRAWAFAATLPPALQLPQGPPALSLDRAGPRARRGRPRPVPPLPAPAPQRAPRRRPQGGSRERGEPRRGLLRTHSFLAGGGRS